MSILADYCRNCKGENLIEQAHIFISDLLAT